MKTIEWFERDVYGTTLKYAADEVKVGQFITALTGKKTISDEDMQNFTHLFGTEWVQVVAPKKS